MRSVLLQLDLSEHGDDEVDGGAAGHEGGHGHHEAGVLRVPHRNWHLDAGHIDLVRELEPVTPLHPGLVAVGGDASIREINY